jgi:hypothetical protein
MTDNNETEHAFTIKPAQSIKIGAETIAYVEFTDDVALVTDSIETAIVLIRSKMETNSACHEHLVAQEQKILNYFIC